METKFQTSFIPKKPLVSEERFRPHATVSIFMILASILFVLSIAGAIFTVVWVKILTNLQDKYRSDLVKSEQSFNLPLIQELMKTNNKIELANNLLSNHLSSSEIFNIIGGLTIDGVRFSSLSYEGPDNAALAKITMKGVAKDYSSIAFQSDVFGKSDKYGTNKVIKNPVLSDMVVDANGNVAFNFVANISASDFNYAKLLETQLIEEGSIPSPGANGTSTQN